MEDNNLSIAPATPFWEGYKRSEEINDQLIQAIEEALKAQPTMRFCQMLMVALGVRDHWNTYDEVVIQKLREFSRNNG